MVGPIVCPNPACGAVDQVIVKVDAWGTKSWDPITGFGEFTFDDLETTNIVCAECGEELDVTSLDLNDRNTEEAAKLAIGEK